MTADVVAVICARMDSDRLPGKALAELAGRSVLAHLVARLSLCRTVQSVVIATSGEPSDDPIAAEAVKLGLECERGSKNDVAARMAGALKRHHGAMVLRVLADCPFVDWRAIDDAAGLMAANKWDVVLPMNFGSDPIYGAGMSPWSWRAWTRIESMSTGEDREHVGAWLRRNLGQFDYALLDLPHWAFRPSYRLEIDEADDLRLARAIWAKWGKDEEPPLKDVVSIMDRSPELALINAGVREKTGPYSGTTFTQAEVRQWEEDYRDRPLVFSDLPSIVGDLRGAASSKVRCPHCGGQLLPDKIRSNNLKLKCARCGKRQTFYANPPERDLKYDPWRE